MEPTRNKDVHPFKKQQIKNLRDFLKDRVNRKAPDPLDSSKFVKSDIHAFVRAVGIVTKTTLTTAPMIPSAVSATQARTAQTQAVEVVNATGESAFGENRTTTTTTTDNNAEDNSAEKFVEITEKDIRKLLVDGLKKELEARGLSTSGEKTQLRKRTRKAMADKIPLQREIT